MGAARANEPVRLPARNVVRWPCTARAPAWIDAIFGVGCCSLSAGTGQLSRCGALLTPPVTATRTYPPPPQRTASRLGYDQSRRRSLPRHVRVWCVGGAAPSLRHRPSMMSTAPSLTHFPASVSQQRRAWRAWCSAWRWRDLAGAHGEATCVAACDVKRTCKPPPPPTKTSPTGATQLPPLASRYLLLGRYGCPLVYQSKSEFRASQLDSGPL